MLRIAFKTFLVMLGVTFLMAVALVLGTIVGYVLMLAGVPVKFVTIPASIVTVVSAVAGVLYLIEVAVN